MKIRLSLAFEVTRKRKHADTPELPDGYIESANVDTLVESAAPLRRLGFHVEHTSEPLKEEGGRR